MKARRQDQEITPWAYWAENHASLMKQVLVAKRVLTTHELREALYHAVKECTQFKPSLAIAVYRCRITRLSLCVSMLINFLSFMLSLDSLVAAN